MNKSVLELKNIKRHFGKGETKTEVLKGIDLKINAGEIVALIGPSGSGKSTLVDLIPRYYDVTEGQICIDGVDIRDHKVRDLRSLIGNVNQEAILFNDTIFNNIAFGVEGATMEQVIAAAKIANAHDFIMEKEEGYQTNIGDRGSKLSGGQRQRISIARAILKNPAILILDEATSALDTESEKIVQEALDRLTPKKPIETEDGFGDRALSCPHCLGPVTNYWVRGTVPKHCQFCGQALDWEGAKT